MNANTWQTCYLGLGSNLTNELGTPKQHIQRAIATLQEHKQIHQVVSASLYESDPMGPQDQPNFINTVVQLQTALSAQELLAVCQQLEQQAGRKKIRHWGERSLDVDVLLYGDLVLNTDTLVIPHPGLTERNFVLVPLYELNAELMINHQLISNYPNSQDWTGLRLLTA